MKNEIKANKFKDRKSLDDYILKEFGENLTINRSNGYIITGKKEELEKLFLTENTTVYAIRVKVIC